MDPHTLKREAEKLLAGQIDASAFLARLHVAADATADAALDLDRERRCGFAEVVFAEGKSVESLVAIMARLRQTGSDVLATRVSPEQAAALQTRFETAAHWNSIGRTVRVEKDREYHPHVDASDKVAAGAVCVVTAGTSDVPIAEEAMETLRWMKVQVDGIYDIGVAGPHRVLAYRDRLRRADAIVVVAGMEGALPSVVGGHVACPVFAVPTSVGYGANFGGLAALLGMLNSCAANVAVVNIDAGFKAGYLAGLVAHRAASTILSDASQSPTPVE